MRRIIESTIRSSPVLWPSQTGSYSDAIYSIRKYVFSSTLETLHRTRTLGIGVIALSYLPAGG